MHEAGFLIVLCIPKHFLYIYLLEPPHPVLQEAIDISDDPGCISSAGSLDVKRSPLVINALTGEIWPASFIAQMGRFMERVLFSR
ncbi:MAG: hypothetical protein HFG27_05715 [Provencibacterium sp.]|jgi:hypothetical protein|nr:hypothetical protein [Provencibacterium sp.]